MPGCATLTPPRRYSTPERRPSLRGWKHLTDGRPLTPSKNWKTDDPLEIARAAISAGVPRMIVLDLAHVGTGRGVGTAELCARLRTEFRDLEIIAGGGVRNLYDLQALDALGIDGVLLASALHDGTIGLGEIQSLRSKISG